MKAEQKYHRVIYLIMHEYFDKYIRIGEMQHMPQRGSNHCDGESGIELRMRGEDVDYHMMVSGH